MTKAELIKMTDKDGNIICEDDLIYTGDIHCKDLFCRGNLKVTGNITCDESLYANGDFECTGVVNIGEDFWYDGELVRGSEMYCKGRTYHNGRLK